MSKIPHFISFFSEEFFVNDQVLTPRLETECLLRKGISLCQKEPIDMIIDIGTGSGILAICLKKRFPNLRVYATDISQNAIDIAERNAKHHAVDVTFRTSDLLDGFTDFSTSFPLFIANLPYLRVGDPNIGDDVKDEDPPLALYGGMKGTELIERFLLELVSWRKNQEVTRLHALIEFSDTQLPLLQEIAAQHGYISESFADYSGIHRFLFLTHESRSLPTLA